MRVFLAADPQSTTKASSPGSHMIHLPRSPPEGVAQGRGAWQSTRVSVPVKTVKPYFSALEFAVHRLSLLSWFFFFSIRAGGPKGALVPLGLELQDTVSYSDLDTGNGTL